MFLIQTVGGHEPLVQAVERNVVIARHDNLRHRGQAIEKRPGIGELSGFCPLGEIAAGDDYVGLDFGGGPQHRFGHLGQKERSEVQIRDMQKGEHQSGRPLVIRSSPHPTLARRSNRRPPGQEPRRTADCRIGNAAGRSGSGSIVAVTRRLL